MKTRTTLHAAGLLLSAVIVGAALAANDSLPPSIPQFAPCPNIGAMQPGDYTDANGNPVFVNPCHRAPAGARS